MTAWNQPQGQRPENMNGMPPTPPAPLSPMVARRRARRVPYNLFRVGVTMLLLAIVLFVAALFVLPSVSADNAVSIAEDGSAQSFTLLEDNQYGFYSDDTNLSCEVTDPSGNALDIMSSRRSSADSPPQVLGFRSTQAGIYTISCTGTAAIALNTAVTDSEANLSFTLLLCSIATGGLAVLLILISAVALLVVNRRWSSRVRNASRIGTAQPTAPSPAGPTGPSPNTSPSPATWSGPSAASGSSGGFPTPQSEPAEPPTSGSYGLAPQQVVYRPMPPHNQEYNGS